MVKQKRGFTLLEMIVIIAIISFAILIIIPRLMGYISNSQRVVCRTNRSTIIREYLYETTDKPSEDISIDSVSSLHDEICPNGGTITWTNTSSGTVTGICSKHGTISGNSFSDGVQNALLDTSIFREENGRNQTMQAYLAQSSSFYIDSGEKDKIVGTTIDSFSKLLKEYFKENGYITSNKELWSLHKVNNQYVFTLADLTSDKVNLDEHLAAQKFYFDSKTGELLNHDKEVFVTTSLKEDYLIIRE